MVASYFFGSYQINANSGGLGLFVETKNLSMPVVKPTSFVVARRDGTKKSGEVVDARQIDLGIRVIGSSRLDMLSRLDSLQQALALRGQNLTIHDTGTRFYQNVDCTSADAKLDKNSVVKCLVACKMVAYDPYAYASTSSSYDTGTVALTSANSLWNFAAINITGGGTYLSYPLLHLINNTSSGSTTLTTARNSGTMYTTLPVNATSFSASVGDTLQLSSGGNTQNVTVGTAFSVGATTITVTSFTANATYPIGATVAKITQWNSIQISQSQDSQTLSANSTASVPLPNANADYVDVQCNPAVGMSIITNNSGKLSDPIGLYPVVEPGTTTFNIGISSSSAVSAEAVISWQSRYLS